MKQYHEEEEEMESEIEDTESEVSDSESDLDEEPEHDEFVWSVIREDATAYNSSLLDAYKNNVIFTRRLKNDKTHRAVMETVKRAMDEDDMDFEEALDYAINKRQHLISRQSVKT